ncbi:MAG: hypothetical protein WC898_04015 [Candidatus Paceibacterota bacterium]|jgi:hypothetical protein
MIDVITRSDFIDGYISERNKSGRVFTYEEYLEHRLADAEEKVRQLTRFKEAIDDGNGDPVKDGYK